jgi:hypothetical protein
VLGKIGRKHGGLAGWLWWLVGYYPVVEPLTHPHQLPWVSWHCNVPGQGALDS